MGTVPVVRFLPIMHFFLRFLRLFGNNSYICIEITNIIKTQNYKIMEEKKEKRVLNNEFDENVKKVSITGLGDDNQGVMAHELNDDELDQAIGGTCNPVNDDEDIIIDTTPYRVK